MQNHTISLLISAVLIIPSIATAAHHDATPENMRTSATHIALQAEIEGYDGDLLVTQSRIIETDEMVSESDSDDMDDSDMMENTDNSDMMQYMDNF